MSPAERERLIEFLRRKLCGPCRREVLNPAHDGCVEATELIAIVENDTD